MVTYNLLLLFVTLLGFSFCEIKKSKNRDIIFLCMVSVAMIVMSSLRADTVGVDYKPYAEYFQTVCQNDFAFLFSDANIYRTEPGYGVLNYMISLFSHNTYLFMGVASILIVGLRAIAIYKYSSSIWISMFVFVSFGFFGYSLCTLRQEIAISIALFAIKYLQDKKPIPYFLIVILAAMFHKSLWILIPIYFIAHIPLNWKSLSVYGAGTLFILLFSVPILNFITQYIFKHYTEDNYFLRGRDFNTAYIPLILFLVVMILQKRILKRNSKNIVLINFICYAGLLFILTLKHFIFQRLALIFLPAALFLIPEILNAVDVDESKYEELGQLEIGGKTNKKQLLQKRGKLKSELHDAKSMYYAAIGFILFGGFVYQLFLLNANRLLIVPYVTFFN
ncbi:EpsG family protein [Oscillospiraceae bacterium PP1C4]